ncbi:hypothetical protein BKK49_05540 [Rodentibacter rarus]|uniref:hypothetical protein n=1 Tax=Rodentibacter rarus TaxID=1908260 RepID=UPI00098690DE|nr:hypothetical protein [Rodentibacter rarus]OOF40915.1 hypothetical protein BKK49_05540 [Rodentibacter rarus]
MFNKKEISIGYFSKDAIPIKVKITRKIPDGVYVWIELERLGHVFWSIHQGRNITVYTYGRYDDVEMWGFTGEGVLIKYVGSLAKTYIKEKLYPKIMPQVWFIKLMMSTHKKYSRYQISYGLVVMKDRIGKIRKIE